jgi:YidC/Oxa1 family membrane protein insertase
VRPFGNPFIPTTGGFTVLTFPYHLMSWLVDALTPLFGAAAAGVAVIVATIAVRLLLLPLTFRQARAQHARVAVQPQVAELRVRHASDPAALLRETSALYRSVGAGSWNTYLPALLQAPVVFVLYRLFVSPRVAGVPNVLLASRFLGVPLAAHGAAGGVVFWAVLVVLALVASLSARRLRDSPVPVRLVPFTTVVFAAWVPVAAGLYLATASTFTMIVESARRGP